jgi:uracil-DNA glycosylase
MATTSTTKSAAAKPAPLPREAEPDHDCPLCPRLVAFRETNRAQKPQWFNAPVPAFGDRNGRLAIVGLAP